MSAVVSYATASELRTLLNRLLGERLEAQLIGLVRCRPYMADLDAEIAACRLALVAAAVSEAARRRAELSGPQIG